MGRIFQRPGPPITRGVKPVRASVPVSNSDVLPIYAWRPEKQPTPGIVVVFPTKRPVLLVHYQGCTRP